MKKTTIWTFCYCCFLGVHICTWFLPVLEMFGEPMLGYQAAFNAIMLLGLGLFPIFAVFGTIVHRLNAENLKDPEYKWTIAFLVSGTIGSLFFLIPRGMLEIKTGGYIWAYSTIGVVFSHALYRHYKSIELLKLNTTVPTAEEEEEEPWDSTRKYDK